MRWSPAQKFGILAILLIGIGISVRLWPFLSGRPLWADESALALSIVTRSYRELISPLDYDQSAPLGYLMSVRAAIEVFGVSEQSLRIMAQVASWFLMIALWPVALGAVGRTGSLIAVGLCVFAPTLLYYANEVKPYASDALIGVLLLGIAQRLLTQEQPWQWPLFGAAGAISIWLAAPAVFVLGAIAVVVGVRASLQRNRRTVAALVTLGCIWALSFLAAYEVSYRRAAESEYMRQFWSNAYISFNSIPDIVQSLEAVSSVFWSSLIGPLSGANEVQIGLLRLGFAAMVIALMYLGFTLVQARKGAAHAWLFVTPALVTIAASSLHLYPVSSRLFLFLIPSSIILLAGGILQLSQVAPLRWRPAALAALSCALPLAGASAQSRWAVGSARWADTDDILRALGQLRVGETVYIYSRGVTTYAFYTTDWKDPDTNRLRRIHQLVGPGTMGFENSMEPEPFASQAGEALVLIGPAGCELLGLPTGMQWRHRTGFTRPAPYPGWVEREAERIRDFGTRGIWLVFIHFIDNADDLLLSQIESSGGVRTSQIVGHHAALYRYEFPGHRVEDRQTTACGRVTPKVSIGE